MSLNNLLVSPIPKVSELVRAGHKLRRKGKIKEAIAQYRQAIFYHSRSALSYFYLAEIFVSQEKLNRATVAYRRAIEFNPCIGEFHRRLGEVYLQQQQVNKAIKAFQSAIALQPNSAISHQNLGEALAQKGKWTPAVAEFYRALKLDPEEVVRHDRELKVRLQYRDRIRVNNPVFIVGCGHSGTSIMLAILGDHPALYPIPYESALFLKPPAEIEETMLQWDSECLARNKQRWIEKTPPHIFQIQKFLKYRPESQFILMLRDGRDVVCSLKYRQKYKTFEERIERWIYDNLAALPYWQHPQVKVIKYEDLIAKNCETIADILDFLHLKSCDRLLNYHQHPKKWYSKKIAKPEEITTLEEHKQFRNWQINQPLFDGRGRWKTEMSATEKVIFKNYAQKYLLQFGYVENDAW